MNTKKCSGLKESKVGDKTSKPVRSSPIAASTLKQTELSPSPYHDNVTQRVKSRSSATCECISADVIRDIIREELNSKFYTQISDIQAKLNRLDETLAHFNTEHKNIIRECEAQMTLITTLKSDNEHLRAVTEDLVKRVNHTEQLSRACNIEIQCVPEHKNENLYNTVTQLANTIRCPLSETDLHYCARIAKQNSKSPRPRSVLVRFSSRRLRDTFLASAIKFNRENPTDKLSTSHLGYGGNKKSAIYVCEHLTPQTKQLHAEARIKAKELSYRYCWVRDGKVFLRKTDNSNYIIVKDIIVLNNLS